MQYQDISIKIDANIIQALEQMDRVGRKILLVFDNNKFISVITIGDIQRAIIKNVSLQDKISSVITFDKIYASEYDSIDDVKKVMMEQRIDLMPVLTQDGKIREILYWDDLFINEEQTNREKIDCPVVIMAGGKGTRLQPLTNVIPKPLIPIGEKTILEEIMDQFEFIGCKKFYMSVNYKSDIMKFYIDNLEHKYNIDFFEEEKPLGTIGSVSLLKGKIYIPFFVSNCDILIDQDYRDVYDYHVSNENDITIVTAVKSYHIPYGVIDTAENGIMTGLTEKPDITYMINTGVYILQPELIDEIPQNQFFHITDLMEKIKLRGGRIGCFPVSEKSWTDIGEWNEYLKLIKQ